MTCDSCNGTGKIHVLSDDGETTVPVECAVCSGTGIEP